MAQSRDGKGEGPYATKLFSLLLCKVEISIQGHQGQGWEVLIGTAPDSRWLGVLRLERTSYSEQVNMDPDHTPRSWQTSKPGHLAQSNPQEPGHWSDKNKQTQKKTQYISNAPECIRCCEILDKVINILNARNRSTTQLEDLQYNGKHILLYKHVKQREDRQKCTCSTHYKQKFISDMAGHMRHTRLREYTWKLI